MQLLHEKNNPNGLKILIASKLAKSSITLEIARCTGSSQGAQLQFEEDGLIFQIDSNAGVLKLMGKDSTTIDSSILIFVDLELNLNELIYQYLTSFSPKDQKSLEGCLENIETSLTSTFLHNNSLSAADVILFCSLLPLTCCKEFLNSLKNFPKLCNYIENLQSIPEFKESISCYYGDNGVTLEGWSPKAQMNLLKGQSTSSQAAPVISKEPVTQSSEDRKISSTEIENAQRLWLKGADGTTRSPRSHPVMPEDNGSNILITSAIPYVNNVPHLGNIIGCVLSADCFSRFCKIRGDNSLYICGTDEYGTATETKAIAEGVTPQEICDKYHALHSSVYKWFNIDFDYFGRTTTRAQTTAAQAIFRDLDSNGLISENSVEQLYCEACERFLADRFVEGTCPHPGCGYEDARGDQCDGCSKLVTATELIKPRCKLCSSSPKLRESQHLFLDLPQVESRLRKWLDSTSHQWTTNAKTICESWLRDGLKERCITRDLKWGTEVPPERLKNKVFYVWYDAPIGYVSMTMEYMRTHGSGDWEKWWRNPSQVQYYEFMAKDNVPFHSIIFPACQIGTGKDWTKVTHLMATEYLNYEDTKFSKSRNVGVFGDQVQETGICSDVWRFYLLYLRPESQDTAFSWVDLQTKNNSELLNNLGNFVNRSLKFVYSTFGGVIPDAQPTADDFRVMAAINHELDNYKTCLSSCRLRDGIRIILSISRIGNQFIQENEPFKLVKKDRSEEDKRRGATVIAISTNIVGLIAVLLEPFMPDTSRKILQVLNHPKTLSKLPDSFTQFLASGHRINEPSPLIRKLTDDEIQAHRDKFAGTPPTEKPKQNKSAKNTQSSQKTENVPTSSGKDDEAAQRLEKEVTTQGLKVRDLKSQKVSKDVLTPEIELLLKLKSCLSIAQGIDPTTVSSGSKKKGKKK